MKRYKGLVFEGAGARGVIFAGALKGMNRRKILKDIDYVMGTSAGSIMALFVSLNFSPKEIEELTLKLKTDNILKRDFFFILSDLIRHQKGLIGFIKDLLLLPLGSLQTILNFLNLFFFKTGYYNQEPLKVFLKEALISKGIDPNITFDQISERGYKELFITVTNIDKRNVEVFSICNQPSMKIIDAVVISSSIPLFFRTVKYDSDKYVDGGVIANFNLNYLSDNKLCKESEIIGLRIDNSDEIIGQLQNNFFSKSKKVKNIFDLIINLIDLLYAGANTPNITEKGEQKVIFLNDRNSSIIDFSMTNEQKNFLIDGGEEDFLMQFSDKEKKR